MEFIHDLIIIFENIAISIHVYIFDIIRYQINITYYFDLCKIKSIMINTYECRKCATARKPNLCDDNYRKNDCCNNKTCINKCY